MQKILISGYTGFIGSNLTEKLSDKYLCGVDIVQNDTVVRHFSWDSLEDCSDQECIIHLAGKAHDIENTSSEKEYFDINVGLTQRLFQYFLKSTAKKFIYFSSVKAVTDTVIGYQLTEDVLPNPKTPYGKSKLEAENYILTELKLWKEGEMSNGRNSEWKRVYILRPCMIHGPGNKGNLNMLFKFQQKGIPWLLGAFENKRSFCSIDNIMFVVQYLVDKNIDSGIYQVADDEGLSTNELIKLIALSLNKKNTILRIPVNLILSFARVCDLFHLPLNSERLRKLTESYLVSNQKIKLAMGLNKMPVSAIEGLQKTLESFKK